MSLRNYILRVTGPSLGWDHTVSRARSPKSKVTWKIHLFHFQILGLGYQKKMKMLLFRHRISHFPLGCEVCDFFPCTSFVNFVSSSPVLILQHRCSIYKTYIGFLWYWYWVWFSFPKAVELCNFSQRFPIGPFLSIWEIFILGFFWDNSNVYHFIKPDLRHNAYFEVNGRYVLFPLRARQLKQRHFSCQRSSFQGLPRSSG